MKASGFPRIWRAFDLDKKQMLYPQDLITLGITLSADGLLSFNKENKDVHFNYVIQWFSGQRDKDGKPVFEGDICKVGVKNEFGSLTEDYAIMRFVEGKNGFMLQMPSNVNGVVVVEDVSILGNDLSDPHLIDLVVDNGKKD